MLFGPEHAAYLTVRGGERVMASARGCRSAADGVPCRQSRASSRARRSSCLGRGPGGNYWEETEI